MLKRQAREIEQLRKKLGASRCGIRLCKGSDRGSLLPANQAVLQMLMCMLSDTADS